MNSSVCSFTRNVLIEPDGIEPYGCLNFQFGPLMLAYRNVHESLNRCEGSFL